MEQFDVPAYISHSVFEASKKVIKNLRIMSHPRTSDDVIEIEARFGRVERSNGKFISGVSVEYFNSLIVLLDAFEFENQSEWVEDIDYFYNDIKEIPTRSRVSINKVTNETLIKTIHKKVVQSQVFEINAQTHTPSHFRVSIASECKVDEKNIPRKTKTNYVRVKNTKKYMFGAYVYELSKVWSGKDHHTAMESKLKDDPVYEVEVETTKSSYMHEKSVDYLALSILLKVVSLCNENCTIEPYTRSK